MQANLTRRLALILAFSLASVLVIYLAVTVEPDFHDAYAFLLQARRINDPAYADVPFLSLRPRALVAMLVGIDSVSRAFTHQYPTIKQYHLLMAMLSIVFCFVWLKVLELFFSKPAAAIAIGMMLVLPDFYWHCFRITSDLLGSLLWGTTIFLFWFNTQLWQKKNKLDFTSFLASMALGLSAALLTLSKHQLFIYFPFVTGIWVALALFVGRFAPGHHSKKLIFLSLGISGVTWIVFSELILRTTVSAHYGLAAQFLEIVRLRNYYTANPTADHSELIQGFYPLTLFKRYGALFLALFLAGTVARLVSTKKWPSAKRVLAQENHSLLVAVTVCSAVYYLIVSSFPSGQDMRWMFPILPLVAGFVAANIWGGISKLPPYGKWIGGAALAVAFVTPVHHTATVLSTFKEERQATQESRKDFFAFLSTSDSFSPRCTQIHACWFEVFLVTYDWPHYRLLAGISPDIHHCQLGDRKNAVIRKELSSSSAIGACFVIPNLTPSADLRVPVLVQKTVVTQATEEQAQSLIQAAAESKLTKVECEDTGNHSFNCYENQFFFNFLKESATTVSTAAF